MTNTEFVEKVPKYLDKWGNLTLLGEMQMMSDEGIIKLRGVANGGRTACDFDYAVYDSRTRDYADIDEQFYQWKKNHDRKRLSTKAATAITFPLKGFRQVVKISDED